MKQFYAYIRVSTAKQGQHGVSLQEQRDAIQRFADRETLTIAAWFEERETAAKRGRAVFNRMLTQLRKGQADGVLMHKIDRSARNLKDWADLGELIDHGVVVRFANDSIDLNSRGGRLSADIQAVVAADFIRNLREETRKGFYGRLKQGIFPLPAPTGYLDGRGRPKEIDPVMAPLIKQAFELFATGRFSIRGLSSEMARRGLRAHRTGMIMSHTMFRNILKNEFYMGVMRIRRTGETFTGGHTPIVDPRTFKRVQEVLAGRAYAIPNRRTFLYRKMFRCRFCHNMIIGEQHRKRIYYRCQTRGCTSVCEEDITETVLESLEPLMFTNDEKAYLAAAVQRLGTASTTQEEEQRTALNLRQAKLTDRLNRITDAFVDGALDRDTFETRKTSVIVEQKEVESQLRVLITTGSKIPDRVSRYLERAQAAYLLYKTGNVDEKRELLKIVTSNREAYPKNVAMTLSEPFLTIAKRRDGNSGNPSCDVPRTLDALLDKLVGYALTDTQDWYSRILSEPAPLRSRMDTREKP